MDTRFPSPMGTISGIARLFIASALLLAAASAAAQAPATPTSVTVTRGDGTLTATWPAANGATSYHVTYSSDNLASWTAASSNHTTTSITIQNVDNSKTYTVAVRALNGNGGSGWRNSAPSAPSPSLLPPATPSSITVARADGTLTASWPAVAGATGYHITYRSDHLAGWVAAAVNHANASITINNVTNSAQYIVAVRARNSQGGSGWRNSSVVGPYEPSMPAPPSSVTVTRSNGTLMASWPTVADATGYDIRYRSDHFAGWTSAATNQTNASITLSSDISNSARYIVAVRSRNAHGHSDWRDSQIVAPYAPSPPATPQSVTVVRADGQLTAVWPAVAGAEGYHVTYLSDAYGDTWTAAATNHPNASITISGNDISNSAYYIVAVRARNIGGDSGWRNSSATGPYTPAPPATPTSVTVTRGDGTLTATWPATWGAKHYHVTYSSDNLASWTAATTGQNHTQTSITISNVDNSQTYAVAVRAGNQQGYGGWRNSASAGPYQSQSMSMGPVPAAWRSPLRPQGPPSSPTRSLARSLDEAALARIALGAQVNGGNGYVEVLRLGDSLSMVAEVEVDPRHVGRPGTFHLLIRDPLGRYSQLDGDGAVRAWDGTPAGLTPLRRADALEPVTRFEIISGLTVEAALTGQSWELFLLYQSEGELIYPTEPQRLRVD